MIFRSLAESCLLRVERQNPTAVACLRTQGKGQMPASSSQLSTFRMISPGRFWWLLKRDMKRGWSTSSTKPGSEPVKIATARPSTAQPYSQSGGEK